MSAFIVDDSVINKILARVRMEACSPRGNLGTSSKYVLKEAGFDPEDEDKLRGLGHEMFRLNIYAVDQRYGDGEAAEFRDLDYTFKRVAVPTRIEAIKALQCLIYQCSEGDVPETRPLYQTLRDLEFAFCRDTVAGLKEYESAPWG